MKFELVTKLHKTNIATSKKIDDKVMLASCDVTEPSKKGSPDLF